MDWPLPQDYNEAIQNPLTCFADPELRQGEAVSNALGLPMPRSGGFADVYEVRCRATQTRWAVKCFTRPVADLRERYAEVSNYLRQAQLPFSIDFHYLQKGITIQGEWYGIVKMDWIEGLLLNEFIRDAADRPSTLESLIQVWLRMAQCLREARLAHGDLQHGNVLLVPGSKTGTLAIRLIDYDGMFVPALAERKPGEVGHPNYQHPLRAPLDLYNLDIDRFPLLLVATVLRCLKVGGSKLWQRYDNGDNLLFREADLQAPAGSALFHELWRLPDAEAHALLGHLMLASRLPPDQTPLVDELFVDGKVPPLSADQEKQAETVLQSGIRIVPKPTPVVPMYAPQPVEPSFPVTPYDLAALTPEGGSPAPIGEVAPAGVRTRLEAAARERQRRLVLGTVAVGTVMAACALIGLVLWAMTGRSPPGTKPAAPVARTKPTGGDKDRRERSKEIKPRVASGKAAGQPPADRNEQDHIEGLSPATMAMRQRLADTTWGWLAKEGFTLTLNGDGTVTTSWMKDAKGYWHVNPDLTVVWWSTGHPWATVMKFNNDFTAQDSFVPHQDLPRSGKRIYEAKRIGEVVKGVNKESTSREMMAVRRLSNTTWAWDSPEQTLTLNADGTVTATNWWKDAKGYWHVNPDLTVMWWSTGHPFATVMRFHQDFTAYDSFIPQRDVRHSGWRMKPSVEMVGEVRAFAGHTGTVHAVAFAHDGRRVVSGGKDNTIRLWDAATGEMIQLIQGHNGEVSSVALTRDGDKVLSSSLDGTIRLWDAKTGKELTRFEDPTLVHAVAFSPDERRLLSSSDESTLGLWDVASTRQILRMGHPQWVRGLAFSPDGRFGLAARADHNLHLWNLTTGREFRVLQGHGDDVYDCAFLPDGYHAITASFDRTLRVWDLIRGREVRQIQGHGARIWSVAVTADGRHALSSGDDKTLRLWDLQTGEGIQRFSCHAASVAVSRDGRFGLSGGMDGVVRLWRLPPAVEVARSKAEKPFEKPSIPSAAERTAAENEIKQSYQSERTPPDPRELANKLLAKGKETQASAAVRFVCWELAWKLAARAGDLGLSFLIIDDLDYAFEVDAWKMRTEALRLALGSATTPAAVEAIVDSSLAAVGEAWAADDYRHAIALMTLIRSAANKSRNTSLAKVVFTRMEEMERLQKEYDRLDKAARTLAANPSDLSANLAMGKFECFQKEDWNKGLPMLAISDDAKLAELARKDWAKPLDAKTLVDVGQSWWDAAGKESEAVQPAIRRWAKKWWWQALPRLSGPDKAAVEDKLKVVRGALEAKPGLVAELFADGDLKRKVKTRIDYQVNFNWGYGAPDAGLPADNFSIRWRGWLVPPHAGKYTLIIHADDGANVYLNGKLRIDGWSQIGRHTAEVQLDEKPYELRIDYHENTGTAMMFFGWMEKGAFGEQPVPPDALFHDLQQEKFLGR